MGYIETDGGSTVSSQGLEGGRRESVVDCTFCWLKTPLPPAFCPTSCLTTSVERTELKDKTWRAWYKVRYPSWPDYCKC